MTRDPERWLSANSDADELERGMLESLRHVSAHAGAKDETWTRLAAQMGAIAVVSSQATAAASQGALSAAPVTNLATPMAAVGARSLFHFSALKLAVTLGVVGVGSGAVLAARAHHERAASSVNRVATTTVSAPAATAVVELPLSEVTSEPVTAAPVVAPPELNKPAVVRSTRDDVAAESVRLADARAALRGGQLERAEQILQRSKHEFPRGVLGQEREVLAIEVLAAKGDTRAVQQRVRTFIARHPQSPHSAALTRFLPRE